MKQYDNFHIVNYPLIQHNLTPIEEKTGQIVEGENVVLVPIFRVGLGIIDGLIKLNPNARVGYVGTK
jgi:uracil phosphoribosyltransferase